MFKEKSKKELEEEGIDIIDIELAIPKAIYKWFRLAAEQDDEKPETVMVRALIEDIRAWMETDDMFNFAYKKAKSDGLDQVFEAYKIQIPSDFKQFLEAEKPKASQQHIRENMLETKP